MEIEPEPSQENELDEPTSAIEDYDAEFEKAKESVKHFPKTKRSRIEARLWWELIGKDMVRKGYSQRNIIRTAGRHAGKNEEEIDKINNNGGSAKERAKRMF